MQNIHPIINDLYNTEISPVGIILSTTPKLTVAYKDKEEYLSDNDRAFLINVFKKHICFNENLDIVPEKWAPYFFSEPFEIMIGSYEIHNKIKYSLHFKTKVRVKEEFEVFNSVKYNYSYDYTNKNMFGNCKISFRINPEDLQNPIEREITLSSFYPFNYSFSNSKLGKIEHYHKDFLPIIENNFKEIRHQINP